MFANRNEFENSIDGWIESDIDGASEKDLRKLLKLAVAFESKRIIEKIAKVRKALLSKKDKFGRNVLTYAVISGKYEFARWLINLGVKLLRKDEFILDAVANTKNLELLRFLKDNRFNFSKCGASGWTVYHWFSFFYSLGEIDRNAFDRFVAEFGMKMKRSRRSVAFKGAFFPVWINPADVSELTAVELNGQMIAGLDGSQYLKKEMWWLGLFFALWVLRAVASFFYYPPIAFDVVVSAVIVRISAGVLPSIGLWKKGWKFMDFHLSKVVSIALLWMSVMIFNYVPAVSTPALLVAFLPSSFFYFYSAMRWFLGDDEVELQKIGGGNTQEEVEIELSWSKNPFSGKKEKLTDSEKMEDKVKKSFYYSIFSGSGLVSYIILAFIVAFGYGLTYGANLIVSSYGFLKFSLFFFFTTVYYAVINSLAFFLLSVLTLIPAMVIYTFTSSVKKTLKALVILAVSVGVSSASFVYNDYVCYENKTSRWLGYSADFLSTLFPIVGFYGIPVRGEGFKFGSKCHKESVSVLALRNGNMKYLNFKKALGWKVGVRWFDNAVEKDVMALRCYAVKLWAEVGYNFKGKKYLLELVSKSTLNGGGCSKSEMIELLKSLVYEK